jgi:hypothetical protein
VAFEFDPVSDAAWSGASWRADLRRGCGRHRVESVSTNWPGSLRVMVESNWMAGRGGQALWFDGVNDFVAVSQRMPVPW